MPYQVIARKWRPRDFSELVGQSHISQTLRNALKNQRLPHALLFTGPRGTGKTSMARILAKSLRCPNVKDFTPCHKCQDCEEISQGRSVDVIELDGASNNGVDAIRELRDSLAYMPASGTHKVYIIDEVHMLSTSAFNALLKSLEEPPEHVIFVLATTEIHKIPNTILSRCQRFDFRRIPTRITTEHLKRIVTEEGLTADEQALWMIARQGEGSMRDSQSLLDQVLTFSAGKKMEVKDVVEVLGLTDRQLLHSTLQALVERKTEAILPVVEKIFHSGFDPLLFIQDLLEELRHLLIVKITPSKESPAIDLPKAEIEHLAQLGLGLSQEDIHFLFDMALKGAADLARSPDPQVVLEMILFRMTAAPRIESLTQLDRVKGKRSVSNDESRMATASPAKKATPLASQPPTSRETPLPPAPAPAKSPTSPPPAESRQGAVDGVSHTSLPVEEKWRDLVQRIKKVNGLVAAQLEHSYLIALEDKSLRIGVPTKMKFLYDQIREPGFLRKLTNFLNTFWGPGYSIKVELGQQSMESAPSPRAIERKRKEDHNEKLRREVESHPLVKESKEVFETELQTIKETQS